MQDMVVIIGGVAGGASVAARLRRLDREVRILVLERGPYISFANCGLPYYIGGVIERRDSLVVSTPEKMKEKSDIDVRVRHEVLSIDCAKRQVEVRNLADGAVYLETYSTLVIATGSSPVIPPIPGIDLPGIYTLWTIPDSDDIRARITGHNVKRAAVIGGGFIGIEAAENLRNLGLEVSIIESADQIMAPLDGEMAIHLQEHIKEQGVSLILSDGVQKFSPIETGIRVSTRDGKDIDVELVILAVGARPNSELAARAGLELGERGGIRVDGKLKTSDPNIYAAGDVIEVQDFITKMPTMIPLAGPANRQGRLVANNIAGKGEHYRGTLGTSVMKVFDMTCGTSGANEKTLQKLGKEKGVDYECIHLDALSHASYYPNAETMQIKVVFGIPDGKVLGAQIIGRENVAKRIDILATAMCFGATMADLKEIELAYAPPFSSSKDPINILGFIAEKFLPEDLMRAGRHATQDIKEQL